MCCIINSVLNLLDETFEWHVGVVWLIHALVVDFEVRGCDFGVGVV